jgi:hypothetical protein
MSDTSAVTTTHEETSMSETSTETTPRRTLKENLTETVDILKHSDISIPKAILIGIVALAAASIIL